MYILVKNPDMAEMLYLDFFIFFKTFLQIALSVIVDAFVMVEEKCGYYRKSKMCRISKKQEYFYRLLTSIFFFL